MRSALLLGLVAFATVARAEDAPIDPAPIKHWIAQQASIHTLSADFVQTRTLRTLRAPLVAPGHVWFRVPDAFRWEIGQPPATIALRHGDSIYLITPKDKKAQHFAADGAGLEQMALMKFPIATDFDDFEQHFQILGVKNAADHCDVSVLPQDPQAQKYLREILLSFAPADGHLLSFQINFRDGSSLRNDFSHEQTDEKLDPHLFDYDLTGYKVRDAEH